jgi:hypothetical protein
VDAFTAEAAAYKATKTAELKAGAEKVAGEVKETVEQKTAELKEARSALEEATAQKVAAVKEAASTVAATVEEFKSKVAQLQAGVAAKVREAREKIVQYYQTVAEKVESSGNAFVAQQKANIAAILASAKATAALTAQKRDELLQKLNILTAFEKTPEIDAPAAKDSESINSEEL